MARKGEEFYELYAQNVYRYLFSISGEADTAEELTQETFYRALKSINTYRGESSPQVWLCAIAKARCGNARGHSPAVSRRLLLSRHR